MVIIFGNLFEYWGVFEGRHIGAAVLYYWRRAAVDLYIKRQALGDWRWN